VGPSIFSGSPRTASRWPFAARPSGGVARASRLPRGGTTSKRSCPRVHPSVDKPESRPARSGPRCSNEGARLALGWVVSGGRWRRHGRFSRILSARSWSGPGLAAGARRHQRAHRPPPCLAPRSMCLRTSGTLLRPSANPRPLGHTQGGGEYETALMLRSGARAPTLGVYSSAGPSPLRVTTPRPRASSAYPKGNRPGAARPDRDGAVSPRCPPRSARLAERARPAVKRRQNERGEGSKRREGTGREGWCRVGRSRVPSPS